MPRLIAIGFHMAFLITVILGSGNGQERNAEHERSSGIKSLADQLASPNRTPVIVRGKHASVKFPADYDREAQIRIKDVRAKASDLFYKSLPYLIRAREDDRYSMTIAWGEGDQEYQNYTVGQVCRDVLESNLEVYRDSIGFAGPTHWHRYDYPISTKWWEQRTGRTLPELQIEAIEWAIERREADSEKPKRRDAEISALKKLRDEIDASGKALPPRPLMKMILP